MQNDALIVVSVGEGVIKGDTMPIRSADLYDAIYNSKDYTGEAQIIHEMVRAHKASPGNRLLDAACGTGRHAQVLSPYYEITLLDLSADQLENAKQRMPKAQAVAADMVDFELDQQFDAITCLFGSIGYVGSVERLNQTLATFAKHLAPGGVVIMEAWLYPEQYDSTPTIRAVYVNEPKLKIARMHTTHIEGRISYLDFRYMVGTPEGISNVEETHALMLFTHEEYMTAFERAGFNVTYQTEGLTVTRGIYIGTKAQT